MSSFKRWVTVFCCRLCGVALTFRFRRNESDVLSLSGLLSCGVVCHGSSCLRSRLTMFFSDRIGMLYTLDVGILLLGTP